MLRKLMMVLAMAALMCFALTGTAFADGKGGFNLNQDATAVAIGGDGGDAKNVGFIVQKGTATQINLAEATHGGEVEQENEFEQDAVILQNAEGGDGGDAEAVAVNAFLVDFGF